MFAGPVGHFELVRMARQRRLFALRFGFGLVVLGVVALNYAGHVGPNRPWYDLGALSLRQLAQFGQGLCGSIMAAQAVLVLGLTPALVADAIAAERQRGTLHDLLTTPLTSREIVLGKLTARLMGVSTYAVLVIPIVSLLTLIGGVSPGALVLGYAMLASSAWFLASLGLLTSVLARRPRDAVGAAYSLVGAWLLLPLALAAFKTVLPDPYRSVAALLDTATAWLWPASPLSLLTPAGALLGGVSDRLLLHAAWMVLSQTVHGTLLIALAAWQLRPAFRRNQSQDRGAARSRTRAKAPRPVRGWLTTRPCGDDPVFWKEAYFSQVVAGPGRTVVYAAWMVVLAAVVAGALYTAVVSSTDRIELNVVVRIGSALLIGAWLLQLAGLTAVGIAREREQDTWSGLLATPLDGPEILRGKMLGPLRATAPWGITIALLWLIGVAAGAVHPLGLIHAALVLVLLLWFVTAFGTYLSLKSKVAWRARAWAQGVLVAPHICCLLPVPSALMMVGVSLWSYNDADSLWGGGNYSQIGFWGAYTGVGMALYGGAACFLTRAAFRNFDALADRPRRSGAGVAVVLEKLRGASVDAPTTETGKPAR